MVSKRAAHSPSEDGLPAGWAQRFEVLKTGRRIKYYEDSRTGQKFFSKDDIVRYVEILAALRPTGRRVRKRSKASKMHVSGRPTGRQVRKRSKASKMQVAENATEELLEWLPRGWLVRIRTRNSGRKCGTMYKTYIDQSTGCKFFSKAEVLRYLKSVKGKSCISRSASANPKVVIETSSEDLPPGWIKELEIRKNAGGIRKDHYYRDPKTGCIFRSRREVERYLETGEISQRAILLKERCINSKDLQLTLAEGENLVDHNDRTHLYADKHNDVAKGRYEARGIATPSVASTSRNDRGKKMLSETKLPSVTMSLTSLENHQQANATSSSAESQEVLQERKSDSKEGNSLSGTSQSSFPIANANIEKELILSRRFSRRIAGLEPEQVPDLVSRRLATQGKSTSDGASLKEVSEEQILECENEKECDENSPSGWRDSDRHKEIISYCRFSERLARLESEQEAKSISGALGVPDATKSHEDRVVPVMSTSKCMATEGSQFLKATVNIEKQQCGSSNANLLSLRKGSIKGRDNLQDKPAPRIATPVNIGGCSALMSTPPTAVMKQEITFEQNADEIAVCASKSMRSKRLDFSQESSKCPTVPVPKPKSYPSCSKISKTKHLEKVGFQDASVVTRNINVIEERHIPVSVRYGKGKRRSNTSLGKSSQAVDLSLQPICSKRVAGLKQEMVGKPPRYESTDGNSTMSLPVKAIMEKQHQEMETNKTRNESTSSSLSPASTYFWSDPCIEFAVKTLTSALPIESFLNIESVSTFATGSGNEKNLHPDRSQKITEEATEVSSTTVHTRETVLALESKKQHLGSESAPVAHGKPGHPGSFPDSALPPNSPKDHLSRQYKAGFMEYANNDSGFARTAKKYVSSSKCPEPHNDSTLMPQLHQKLVVRSMQTEDAVPKSCLSFGDCWSDPLLEHALETPTGLIPLKGDLSKLARIQHHISASCSHQEDTSFQLHETTLNHNDGGLTISDSCFETDIRRYVFARGQNQPSSKKIPSIEPPILASANRIVLACSSSMNCEAYDLKGKTKGGRPRKKS